MYAADYGIKVVLCSLVSTAHCKSCMKEKQECQNILPFHLAKRHKLFPLSNPLGDYSFLWHLGMIRGLWIINLFNFLSLTVFLSLYFWNQKCSEIPAIKCGSQIEAGALFTLFSRSWGLNRGNTINNEAYKINFYKIPNY